ncbi:hypothetical protein CP082626L3_0879A, partial [Chlamydia psittaci 08-2626_L3]|jgi:hypothetical protein
MIGL